MGKNTRPCRYTEQSGLFFINLFIFDICIGQHWTSDNFFISPKYTGQIFAQKSFMSGVKKYKTKFTQSSHRTSICPVSNILFFDTGHSHWTVRCIGRVVGKYEGIPLRGDVHFHFATLIQ